MNANRILTWLSLAANFGVVIGLFLVAFQIRQDASLARAQLFSDATNSRREWNQAMMGENPLATVAKSIERPHELTLAELHAMDMYFIAALNELRRLELLKRAGLDVEASVEGMQYFYFGSNFAKAWFQEYRANTEFDAIRRQIDEVPASWVVDFFERVRSHLEPDAAQSLSRNGPTDSGAPGIPTGRPPSPTNCSS